MNTIGVSFLDPLDDYELIHRIGCGTYGDVFKVSEGWELCCWCLLVHSGGDRGAQHVGAHTKKVNRFSLFYPFRSYINVSDHGAGKRPVVFWFLVIIRYFIDYLTLSCVGQIHKCAFFCKSTRGCFFKCCNVNMTSDHCQFLGCDYLASSNGLKTAVVARMKINPQGLKPGRVDRDGCSTAVSIDTYSFHFESCVSLSLRLYTVGFIYLF